MNIIVQKYGGTSVENKEKLEKVKNDLLKSITSNKTNISNIEVKIEDIYKFD